MYTKSYIVYNKPSHFPIGQAANGKKMLDLWLRFHDAVEVCIFGIEIAKQVREK